MLASFPVIRKLTPVLSSHTLSLPVMVHDASSGESMTANFIGAIRTFRTVLAFFSHSKAVENGSSTY